ncbi:MAG TPA: DUF4292 domain-containing protein [Bacteroidales bacterium]|nr:DUF4292 domain-containing protein [Bacteroidales bacterium]
MNRGKSENIRPVKLYRYLEENTFNFNNLTLKFSAEIFAGESSETFSGIIRMQKDSIMWISLRSYNIEGARIVITNDSVKYLNRLDNTYYLGDFSFFTEKFQIDLDYNAIQSILTNNFFFYPETQDTTKSIANFKPCDDSSFYCMSSISQRKYARYYVDDKRPNRWERKLDKETADTLDNDMKFESNEFVFQIVKVFPELYRVRDMYIENYIQQQSLYILYDKLTKSEEQYFPKKISIELLSPMFETQLVVDIESVTINSESMSYPFKIAEKYTELTIQ